MKLQEFTDANKKSRHHCGGCDLPEEMMDQLSKAEKSRLSKDPKAPSQEMMCEWLKGEGYNVSRTSLREWLKNHG